MHGYNNNKKIIALLTFKNEEWILEEYLKSIRKITNHIIAYDDHSTDKSRAILENAGATIISRDYKRDSYFAEYEVRQTLLEEGRKRGGTHFICLDADEIFTNEFLKDAEKLIFTLIPGQSMWLDWIHLYKQKDQERIGGDYNRINKAFIFCDDSKLAFTYAFIGVSRTPTDTQNRMILNRTSGAVIHFQFFNIERALTKRIWYMCSEIIKGSRSTTRINMTYATQKDVNVPTRFIDSSLFADLGKDVYKKYDPLLDWRFHEILEWFSKYGILRFEKLDIWDNDILRSAFLEETQRYPQPQIIPHWLIKTNCFKNKIINQFRICKKSISIKNLPKKIHSLIPLYLRKKIGPIFALLFYIFRTNFKKDSTHIMSLDATIDYILKHNTSMIRFGDGEISLLNDDDLHFQRVDSVLKEKLIGIFKSYHTNLLICIPNIFGNLRKFNSRSFWFSIHHVFKYYKYWKNLLSKKQIYGDAFVTRPFLSYKKTDHAAIIFDKLFSIWKNKKITLIEGEKSRLGVGNDMFNEVLEIERILCPAENAFAKYTDIKEAAFRTPKNRLILVSLGPTAKILAYELFLAGYRVLDIGHIDMEYEMFLRKSHKLVKVKYKYFNEIGERNPEECKDLKYLSEIINRITI